MRVIPHLTLILTACVSIASAQTVLTFDEAVCKALSNSPNLRICTANLQEGEGECLQSQVLPNPLFAYSVENILGNKDWKGWKSAESRYEIFQPIELGGKRQLRTCRANYQYYAQQAEYEIASLRLLNAVLKSFAAVAASQEQYHLALEQKRISEEVLNGVKAKVQAGKVSQIQQNKAEIAHINADISLNHAAIELESAKERLSLIWGEACPDFERVCFDFYTIEKPQEKNICLEQLKGNPELLQSYYELQALQHNVALEESERIPDVVVNLGYKTLREGHRKGVILGASFPIPIFNRNQGNIEKARSQVSKSCAEYEKIQLILENRLSIAYKELVRAYQESERFRTTVLTLANQSFEFAQRGYKEGKFEYLDMLDSQRTLFEVKEKYIQSLLTYHQKRADIEYITTGVE